MNIISIEMGADILFQVRREAGSLFLAEARMTLRQAERAQLDDRFHETCVVERMI